MTYRDALARRVTDVPQDNVFVCKRQIDFFKSSMEAEREGHALELQRVLVPFEMREQELKSELMALQQALDDA